ncbi:malate:quinone oxidoreductase, partial [Mammaliicoccus sciuri]|uniref:malate:quinone oxidoreductase n=1 Tax=Mammaliicoccus sciuri TaxID=1296 RepID=UPI000D44A7C4
KAHVHFSHEVVDCKQHYNSKWEVKDRTLETGKVETHVADYIFIGAGGHAIPLIQKTKIPESRHRRGFTISGAFLVCNNPRVVSEHNAKVYGKEPPGTTQM